VKIYLIRHAHAVDESSTLPDEHRYLSVKGRRVMKEVGAALLSNGVKFDAVVTSPLVRAVQTAEILAESVGFFGIVEALPPLRPGVPPRVVAAELPARGMAVAVVGHEPGISALGALLVGRPAFPPFKKAQVCLLDQGQAGFTLNPDTLELDRLLWA
jgi:phosphohistidine phosphatase